MAIGIGDRPRPGVPKHTVSYEVDPSDGSLSGSGVGKPTQVLLADWKLSNCFEASNGRSTGLCRYDSKPSVVAWRGALWLFVRANVDTPGGRHVQVSRRPGLDPTSAGVWPRLKTLHFNGYKIKKSNNIYFFPVRVDEWADELLRALPRYGGATRTRVSARPRLTRVRVPAVAAVIEGVGAVYSSRSRDGVLLDGAGGAGRLGGRRPTDGRLPRPHPVGRRRVLRAAQRVTPRYRGPAAAGRGLRPLPPHTGGDVATGAPSLREWERQHVELRRCDDQP